MEITLFLMITEFIILTIAAFISVVVWKRARHGSSLLFSMFIIFAFIGKGLNLANILYFSQNKTFEIIAAIFMTISTSLCLFTIIDLYKKKQ